ncbi:ABC transporter permease [Hyphomicrobium methylovorum]|uniref:FecCD family ABC transporter permease n=1 Tax=Hyphomicrobium methylovorum TaxID=84 RepID=UPI0015E77A87|nr:iron ABC transporter permease [Hyphomicrobium methylovorum]MBA2125463.1 ABC transporter permease [Hyphomicrobium methylovorum]
MSYRLLILLLAILTGALFFGSMLVGPANVDIATSMRGLFTSSDTAASLVMWEIRMPRAVLGLMIGATLGLSGAVLQGYLRNPLADPAVLGVSASASLGAVLAIYTGLSAVFPLALPLAAIGASIAAVLLLQSLAGVHAGTLTLILAGIAISSFASALTSLALNLSPNPFAAMEMMYWMMGSLTDRSWQHVWLSAPFMLIGWGLLAVLGRSLNALTLGPDVARSLGIRLERTQMLAVLGTAASVGAATAVAGGIGFIGLIVPHLLRPLVGAEPKRLLLTSALAGAALLLAADVAVRVIAPARDLKLGVLTAIVGAPFFLWLVIKHRKNVL